MSKQPHLVGLGNALVDVVAPVDPQVIARHGLTVGGMHLVDEAAAHALFDEVAPGVQQSGGSVANSVAHAAELGLATTYLGKTAEDSLGRAFRAEMDELGIAAPVPLSTTGSGTGRCVVLVTPDGERTMSTHLGAAVELEPGDIASAYPEGGDMLLIEGYLWDAPHGAEAIAEAARRARDAGASVAMTPSDSGCVARNLDAMRAFVEAHADILIGNAEEVAALSGAATPQEGLAWAMARCKVAAVTQSEEGALVADASGTAQVPPDAVPEVVDSTGAGDAFAAGFLAGLAQGESVAEAGAIGARQAARVLGHFGARNGPAARALSLPAA